MIYLFVLEIEQLKTEGPKKYFKDYINYFDLLHVILSTDFFFRRMLHIHTVNVLIPDDI